MSGFELAIVPQTRFSPVLRGEFELPGPYPLPSPSPVAPRGIAMSLPAIYFPHVEGPS